VNAYLGTGSFGQSAFQSGAEGRRRSSSGSMGDGEDEGDGEGEDEGEGDQGDEGE
jgi:hypothetical protein